MSTSRPEIVEPVGRIIDPAQQTKALHREQAFGGHDRWIGLVRSDPGEWSGWHHHAERDTYFYVLQGQLEFEYGDDERLQMHAGDFVHMPPRLIHRERTHGEHEARLVFTQLGSGPTVVNVAGPAGSAPE